MEGPGAGGGGVGVTLGELLEGNNLTAGEMVRHNDVPLSPRSLGRVVQVASPLPHAVVWVRWGDGVTSPVYASSLTPLR